MKKNILSICILMLYGQIAIGQISNDRGTFYKPAKGDWSVETLINTRVSGGSLFTFNDPILQNFFNGIDKGLIDATGGGGDAGDKSSYFPMIRARRWSSEKTALRYMLNFSYTENSLKTDPVGNFPETLLSNSELGVAVGFGFEKHLTGAERLSTFIGADLLLAYGKYSSKAESDQIQKSSKDGYAIAFRGFTGMDYYFIPKVYLGIELGMGFGLNQYRLQSNAGVVSVDGLESNSNFSLTPFVSPSVKLGWRL